jgi:hypothetical protein
MQNGELPTLGPNELSCQGFHTIFGRGWRGDCTLNRRRDIVWTIRITEKMPHYRRVLGAMLHGTPWLGHPDDMAFCRGKPKPSYARKTQSKPLPVDATVPSGPKPICGSAAPASPTFLP